MENLKAVLEALLFSSDQPLSLNRLKDVLGEVEKKDIEEILRSIADELATRPCGFVLEEVAGGYQFRTRPEFGPWVRKLKGIRPSTLSPAAMETLAVIAYRQPVVKADIDKVRGVDVSGALKGLLEKKLVKIMGRKDVPGRPIMYGTGREFLGGLQLERSFRTAYTEGTQRTAGGRVMQERLQKILSAAGIASRRAAEDMILQGRVSVNGNIIRELGSKADPQQDEIRIDGGLISTDISRVYIMLNKPSGYVTTLKDPEGRPKVTDLLGEVDERGVPGGPA